MKSNCEIHCDKHYAEVEDAVNTTLEHLKFTKPCEVSVSFVSIEEIQELNKKYRDLDEPTDVLSFPQDDWDADVVQLGDIVICEELCEDIGLLVVHSMLHLFGHDHHDGTDTMFDMQDEILEVLYAKTD